MWGSLLLGGLAGPAGAQDLEMEAFVRGRPLPAAYHERVARAPEFFRVRSGWTARGLAAMADGESLEGELPLLVVPALFADSPEPTVPASEIARIFFDGPYEPGTLARFFAEQSRGRLTLSGGVAPWVRSELTAAEVRAGSYGLGDDARTGEFLVQIVAAADASMDLRAFDNDGPDGVPDSGDDDGVVDALVVEFLEAPLTCAGQGPTIWGHRAAVSGWTGEPYLSDDVGHGGEPIRVDDYIVQPGVFCDGSLSTVVVAAHELGHILGLPDLYDGTEGLLASQRNWVVGCWSIMAAGQWGCGPALAQGRWDRPPHMGPWEKAALGWLPELTVADEGLDLEYELRSVESSGEVLRVDLSATEYLLVEYRDGSGFDRNLPATGILVHHVDETRPSGNRRCRTCPRRYLAALLEADANRSLLIPEGQGGSRGEAGDIFRVGQPGRVTNATDPSTRLSSGAPSDVTIYDLRVEDGVARVRLSTRVVPIERLLGPFFGDGAAPDAEEATYLDRLGNGNGRYDVADLRAYLAEHPSVTARVEGR